ncbi:MAG: hypothetical protein VB024_00075 [Dysgonamonadaceae bacterium]|nr:hypothetical protein [Dysgonamonadaceae bacterium]MDD3309998.1 hypothetical protein [Dysgonamonadaceae bacterium]MDD3900434.1 hypothetical protein [Dysgonamonadaceae bacterium]MDD4399702.1 hypothetical protein [Dysgonamonadaceae bacterium]MEA5080002.1 hypothetical protein [Dysgonamonadaceae bacterium]
MKFTTRLFLHWISIFLVFFVAVIAIMSVLWKSNFEFWQLMIVFFIAGVIPPGIITSMFYRRLNYMESDDIEPPKFTGSEKAEFIYKGKTDHPFDEILQRIDRQWIISYSDREKRVLKFKTDSRVFSWGIGGYLRMIDDNKVQVYVYPPHKDSRRELLVMNQTLSLIQSILNPR